MIGASGAEACIDISGNVRRHSSQWAESNTIGRALDLEAILVCGVIRPAQLDLAGGHGGGAQGGWSSGLGRAGRGTGGVGVDRIPAGVVGPYPVSVPTRRSSDLIDIGGNVRRHSSQ